MHSLESHEVLQNAPLGMLISQMIQVGGKERQPQISKISVNVLEKARLGKTNFPSLAFLLNIKC